MILLEFVPKDGAVFDAGGVETLVRNGASLDTVKTAVDRCDVLCVACLAVQTAYFRRGRLGYRVPYAGDAPNLHLPWSRPRTTPPTPITRRRAFAEPQLSEDERERLRIAERDRRMALRTARGAVRAGEGGLVPPPVPQPQEFSGAGVVEPEVSRASAADLPSNGVTGDEPAPEQPPDDAAQEDVRDDAATVALGEPVGEATGGRGEDDAVDAGDDRRLDAGTVDRSVVQGRRVVRRLRQRSADRVGEAVPTGEDPERFE